MKTIVTTLLILLTSLVFGQWNLIHYNYDITTSCFAKSKDTCFVTGYRGKIFRTVNGGATWDSVQTVFKTSWFLDIHFPSKNIGYACGGTAFGNHRSIVAKTVNGGQTWDSLASELFGYDLFTVHFLSNNIGFLGAVGGILRTVDGGQTFTTDTLPLAGAVKKFFFTSSTTGFAAVGKKVMKTTDMGMSWNTLFTDTTEVNSVYFINSNVGFAVGDKGALLKTTNGGGAWTKSLIDPDTVFLHDIKFINSNVGFIAASKWQVGNRGYIYKTVDGGVSWNLQNTIKDIPLSGISMVSENEGYATGYFGTVKLSSNATQVNSIKADEAFGFYPNPVSSELSIRGDGQINVTIYNATGQVVIHRILHGESRLDVNDLKNGVYLIELRSETGTGEFRKLIKN
jgi:photosystem II stability/assembly factor-like uncharacterized protein